MNPIERRVQEVLAAHQKLDIKNCSCGKWGSDHGHLGQAHAVHIVAELEAAGIRLVQE